MEFLADRKKEAGESKRLTRESAEKEEAERERERACDREGDNQIEKRHKRQEICKQIRHH